MAQLGVKRVEGDVDPAMGVEHPGLFPLHFPRVRDAVQEFGVGYNAQVWNTEEKTRQSYTLADPVK